MHTKRIRKSGFPKYHHQCGTRCDLDDMMTMFFSNEDSNLRLNKKSTHNNKINSHTDEQLLIVISSCCSPDIFIAFFIYFYFILFYTILFSFSVDIINLFFRLCIPFKKLNGMCYQHCTYLLTMPHHLTNPITNPIKPASSVVIIHCQYAGQ